MLPDKITEVISGLCVVPQKELNDEDILVNIGIDSLKMVELIIALEEKFDIRFNDSALEPSRLKTIKNIITLVAGYAAVE